MIKKLVFLFSILVLFPSASFAGRLEKLKDGYGWVVIAIDDASPRLEKHFKGLNSVLVTHGINVMRIDSQTKTIPQHGGIFRSPDEVFFYELIDKKTEKRYWVGQMKEADAVIAMFYDRLTWYLCFNSETSFFHVAANEFNFIGSFDATSAFIDLAKAGDEGKIPTSASPYSMIAPVVDGKLKGFIPSSSNTEAKAEVDTFLSAYLNMPVSTVIPKISTTNFNLGKDKSGKESCLDYKK